MRRRLFLLLALLPSLVTAACFRDPDPVELDLDPVHVHAVLEAGASTALVLITRPPDPEANCNGDLRFPCTAPEPRWEPFVSGADVRLIQGADTISLAERSGGACAFLGIYPQDPRSEGSGCYDAVLPAPIESGAEYELEIRLTDGSMIIGRTLVPGAPTLLTPAPMARLDIWCAGPDGQPGELSCYSGFINDFGPASQVPVRWTPAPAVELSQVALWGIEGYRNDAATGGRCVLEPAPYYDPVTTSRDSVTWAIYGANCHDETNAPIAWDSISAEVVVTHLDPAYAEYLEAVSDRNATRIGKVQAGLEGALGVFGAVASDRRMVMMVRRQGSPPTP